MTFTIPAEVHTDDHKATAKFDALPYFMQASEEEIVELARCGFGGDYPADNVAEHMSDLNEQVGRVFTYLGFEPENMGEKVGFECHIEEAPALAWLKANSPKTYQRLIDEDLIDLE